MVALGASHRATFAGCFSRGTTKLVEATGGEGRPGEHWGWRAGQWGVEQSMPGRCPGQEAFLPCLGWLELDLGDSLPMAAAKYGVLRARSADCPSQLAAAAPQKKQAARPEPAQPSMSPLWSTKHSRTPI